MAGDEKWLTVEEARERILAHCTVMPVEEKPLLDVPGQVLAEDVVAEFPVPPADNTAMDGYAVRAASTAGARAGHPVELRVIGELAAGYLFDGEVGEGEAVRIMTGAPLPHGADAVVPFEETEEEFSQAPRKTRRLAGTVRILKAATPGANIRRAGEDMQAGQVVLRPGRTLGPAQVGVIASLGRTTARVHRRPRVAIISTGDEILEPGSSRLPGMIYDSNAYSVSAMVSEFGGTPLRLGIARDTFEALSGMIRQAVAAADMVVTSAGVSRGDYDVVKEVLAREGDIDFWLVKMRPGKPLAFGAFIAPDGRRVPHLGLPGNPVSSMITFELFGRPAIARMLGREALPRPVVEAICADRIRMTDERRFYARARLRREPDGYHAALTGSQGSGVLTSMAEADCLIVVPEGSADVQPGDRVQAMLLG